MALGKKFILCITDAFSKYEELVTIQDKSAPTVASRHFQDGEQTWFAVRNCFRQWKRILDLLVHSLGLYEWSRGLNLCDGVKQSINIQ
jgi:hypothetical protein